MTPFRTVRDIARWTMTLLAVGVALAVAASLSVCNLPPPHTASDSDCAWERAAVEATGAAIGALDATVESIPEGVPPEINLALDAALNVVDVGRSAVNICDDARDRPRWWSWAGDALEAVSAVVGVMKTLGVRYSEHAAVAVSFIQAMLGAVAPPDESRPASPSDSGPDKADIGPADGSGSLG